MRKEITIHLRKPYIRGRWMVTGPNYPDGSGWSLCIHKGGMCQRCVAEYGLQRDAYRAVRLNHATEKPLKR